MHYRQMKVLLIELILLGLLALPAGPVYAQNSLTPEILVSLEQVTSARISPDGQTIAYLKMVPRGEEDSPGRAFSELWVSDIAGKEHRRFTYKTQPGLIAWSPDGKLVTFTAKKAEFDEHVQVYGLPVDGGAARQLTESETSVLAYRWSPDGRYIAYIAVDAEPEEAKAAKKAGEDWIIYDQNLRHHRVWVRDVAEEVTHMLYSQEMSTWDLTWAPDSKTLVLQASELPLTDYSYMFKQLYTASLDDGAPRHLCETKGKLGPMAVSPDGKTLAFAGATGMNDPLAQSLFVVSLSGGVPVNLTKGFQGSVRSLAWKNDREIVALSTEGVENTLRVFPKKGGASKLLYRGAPVLSSFSLHPASRRFAAIGHAAGHPRELFTGKLNKSAVKRLTHSNPVLEKISLARQEVVEWSAPDGLNIQGVLTYPLDYQPGQRYPLVLQIHGGPEGVSLNGWSSSSGYPVQVLAADGYMVLQPNYRASGGRGVEFSKMDHNDLGGKEFDDVLAGIDALVERGLVDNERVGTGGWSYGGYFSAWAATKHSQRFKASVVAAGLTNWISFTGTTDIPYEMSLVHWNSWWMDQRDLHWERSPLYHIGNAQTPTLVVHGLKDERVHPEQSLELYTTLKIRDIPTKLIMYPREPHGLREVQHQKHFIQSVLDWYKQYLKKAEKSEQVIN